MPSTDPLQSLLDEALTVPTGGLRKPQTTLAFPEGTHPPGTSEGSGQRPEDDPLPLNSSAIAKLRYTHDAMVDLIIANPAISQNALASRFGYSASWVSQVIASDAFQAKLAERTKDMVDPTLRATVEDRFKGMVLRSLEILREKLNGPSSAIPDNLALRTLEIGSRALGYGALVTPKTEVNVEVHLEALGNNLTKLLERRKSAALVDVGPGSGQGSAMTRTRSSVPIDPGLVSESIQ